MNKKVISEKMLATLKALKQKGILLCLATGRSPIAFADDNNDIEMLAAVGQGLAMDNASEDLKTIADEVIGHVAEDGIYEFCLENNLI